MSEGTGRRPNPIATRRGALILLAAGLAVAESVAVLGTPRATASPLPTLRVDPNTAPEAVLEALPRIGPAIAGRIVEAREQAPFVDLGDFDRRVKGIGPVAIAALRPHLRFEDGTRPQPKDR